MVYKDTAERHRFDSFCKVVLRHAMLDCFREFSYQNKWLVSLNYLPQPIMDGICTTDQYTRERYRDTLAQVPLLPEEKAETRRRREMSYLNLRWFMQTLLDRMDRTSMAWGLEARVPFADHRIVEYVYNVPWSMKYENGMEKKLLRDACKDLLPPQLLYRKKSPYPKTYSPVYEALLAERFEQLLANPQAPVHRFMDRKKAAQFLAQPKDYGRPWFGQLMAGPQMIAYFLQVNDWMERYGIS